MWRELGDLISRKALIQDAEDTVKFSECVNHESEIMDCIRYEPAEDAEIVRHAKWEPKNVDGCCTICGCGKPCDEFGSCYESDYCQWCGAKMDL